MIAGVIFLIIAIFSFIVVRKTDYEDVVVESHDDFEEIENKTYLYSGIFILFGVGVFLIIRNI